TGGWARGCAPSSGSRRRCWWRTALWWRGRLIDWLTAAIWPYSRKCGTNGFVRCRQSEAPMSLSARRPRDGHNARFALCPWIPPVLTGQRTRGATLRGLVRRASIPLGNVVFAGCQWLIVAVLARTQGATAVGAFSLATAVCTT